MLEKGDASTTLVRAALHRRPMADRETRAYFEAERRRLAPFATEEAVNDAGAGAGPRPTRPRRPPAKGAALSIAGGPEGNSRKINGKKSVNSRRPGSIFE